MKEYFAICNGIRIGLILCLALLIPKVAGAQDTGGRLSLGYLTLSPLALPSLQLASVDYRQPQSAVPDSTGRSATGTNVLTQLPLNALSMARLESAPLRLPILGYVPNSAVNSQFLQTAPVIATAPSPISQYANPAFNPNMGGLNLGLGLEAIGLIRNLGGGNLNNASGITGLLNAGNVGTGIPGLPALPTGR